MVRMLLRTALIPAFALIWQLPALSDEVPRVLLGDWYSVYFDCGTPRAEVSGWYFGEDGRKTNRVGSEVCKTRGWKAYDFGLGSWSYVADCAGKDWYGSARLQEQKGELWLEISEEDRRTGNVFAERDPKMQRRDSQLRRCSRK